MGRKNQYFGVKVGRKPGVYTDWSECKTQIIGVESAKWKRFSTYEEANVYCCTDTIKIEGQEVVPGSIARPISIEVEDAEENKPSSAHLNSSPERCYNPKRYRPDTNTGSDTNAKVDCQKTVMRAMLGLTNNVYNPSSTPTSSPSAKRKTSVLDTSNISAISCSETNVKPEESEVLSSNADTTLTNASVTEIKNSQTKKSSFLPDIRKTNKTVQPMKSKIRPKMKHRLVKQPVVPVHKYVEEQSESTSGDDDIEIVENPLREIQMSQSTSEEYLRVGSSEGEVAVGIFWDIENVRMPKGLNPAVFITKLREKFVDESSKFCEKHFYVVCDAREESNLIMKQLFEFHVRIVHVPRLKANSSDNVIRDLMHEFVGYNKYCRIVLISGDCDFSHDIHNFRRNKKCECILIHNPNAKESLIRSATSAHLYTDLIKGDIIQHKALQNNQQNHPGQFRGPRKHAQLSNHYLAQKGQYQMSFPNKKVKNKQNKQQGGMNHHRDRFYNQDFNHNGNEQLTNGDQAVTNNKNGEADSPAVEVLDESLPDFIPLSPKSEWSSVSKAYYRKKKKEVRSPRNQPRKQKSKKFKGVNISVRDY